MGGGFVKYNCRQGDFPTVPTILEPFSMNQQHLITLSLYVKERQPLKLTTSFKLAKYSIECILYPDTSTLGQN